MKKRYKLLLGFAVLSLIILFIYSITKDKKIYYLSLGDSLAYGLNAKGVSNGGYSKLLKNYLLDRGKLELFVGNYENKNYRSIDVLNDIKENKKVKVGKKKITIKNALVKADVITLSIGMNDLFYKLKLSNDIYNIDELYKYVDDVFVDIEKLFLIIRKITKEDIYIIGFYNPFMSFSDSLSDNINPVIEYANSKLDILGSKYNISIINVQEQFKCNSSSLPPYYEIHPTDFGYKLIANEIIAQLNEKTLAK